MARFAAADGRAFITRALAAVGLPDDAAAAVAELMISADLRGADGHGIFRLPQYGRRIRAGGVNVRPKIRTLMEADATAVVDRDNGTGHLVMRHAAELAIATAKKCA